MYGPFPHFGGVFALGLIVVVAWSLVWKGLALWRAARRGDTAWFVILLILNTVGILEIIYLIITRPSKTHHHAHSNSSAE